MSELTTQVQLLRSPAAPPTPPSFSIPGNHSPQHEPRLPAPEKYAGDPNLCRAFLTKCSLFFLAPATDVCHRSFQVALVLTLLSGKAALWGTAVWENRHPCCSSFHSLSQEMRRVFARALVGKGCGGVDGGGRSRLLSSLSFPTLRQGEQSVSDYSIQFRTLAAECEWNGRRSGTCSCMGWPTVSIKRLMWWSYLSVGRTCGFGLTRGCTASATRSSRSTQVNTEISFLRQAIRSVTRRLTNPCRWVELGSPGRREIVGGRGGYVYCGAAGHFLVKCPVKDQARQ